MESSERLEAEREARVRATQERIDAIIGAGPVTDREPTAAEYELATRLEALKMGVTFDQLRDARAAALKTRLVREAEAACPSSNGVVELTERVARLEARLLGRRVVGQDVCMDPLDAFVMDRLLGVSGPDAPVSRAEFEAFNERLKKVDWSVPDPDTPETLDPDLSDEAQASAQEVAVREVIGTAIGVVRGVCPRDQAETVRAVRSLYVALGAAVRAAKVVGP